MPVPASFQYRIRYRRRHPDRHARFDQARTSQKVIVLMTDGEDDQTAMDAAAKEAAEAGAIIHTIASVPIKVT